MKSLLISHTDLDGISPIILLKLCNIEFDYETVEVREIDETVMKYLNQDISQYENIFITDICPSEEIVESISQREDKEKFKIFDHHISRSFLYNYDFAILDSKECGTSLFYNYLKETYSLNKPVIDEYVSHVIDLDLWYWQEKNNLLAKQLGDLQHIYGKEIFVEKMYQKLKAEDHFKLSEFDMELLKIEQNRILKYIEKKNNDLKIIKYKGKKAGLVFSERYTSEMGNALALEHPELDYIIMVNISGGISFRTIKEDVDLSIIATELGGGGHKKASGLSFPKELREELILRIFENSEIEEKVLNEVEQVI